MSPKIRMALVSMTFLVALLAGTTPASAHDTDCIDYKLLFTDGHGVEGTKCAGENPDLHVPGIDITCKDKFKDGKIMDVDDHFIAAFYIVIHDKKDKDNVCGQDFDMPPTPGSCDSVGLEAAALPGGEIELTLADYALATASMLHRAVGGDPETSLGPINSPSGPLYTDSDVTPGAWHAYRLAISAPFAVECAVEIFLPIPDHFPDCVEIDLQAELQADGTVLFSEQTPTATFNVYRDAGAGEIYIGSGFGSDNPLFVDDDPVRGATNVYRFEDGQQENCFVEVIVPRIVLDCDDLDPHATVLVNGSVLLTFNALASADSLAIGRSDEGADPELLAFVPNDVTTYLDNTTIPGTSSQYVFVIIVDNEIREPCWIDVEIPIPPERECIEGFSLNALAHDGGSIELKWNIPDDARGVRVLRDGVFIGGVAQPGETYNDTTAIIGESYVYTVEVWYADAREPAFSCHIEVTSVPVFGTVLATALAVGLGSLAYLGARRRR